MIHNYLVCVIIGFVIGWIVGWMARGDENRRYHARRWMANATLAPLPPARVVAWIPRGSQALTPNSPNDSVTYPGRAGAGTNLTVRCQRTGLAKGSDRVLGEP